MVKHDLDTNWVGKKPFAYRMFLYLLFRPFIGFSLFTLLVAVLAWAPSDGALPAILLLLGPWLLLFLVFLNLPLVGAAVKAFRLPEAVRVNHALEHGTIHFLRLRHGKKHKIGGLAEADGFRLNGVPSEDTVTPAFQELKERLARGDTSAVLSPRCGSMVVTAQALAVVLLTIASVVFLLFGPDPRTKLGIFGMVLVVYLLSRHGLGLFLQRRLFLSLDFHEASIHSINRVKPQGPLERQPVYFVRTLVRRGR